MTRGAHFLQSCAWALMSKPSFPVTTFILPFYNYGQWIRIMKFSFKICFIQMYLCNK
jgi:hypothetical protein